MPHFLESGNSRIFLKWSRKFQGICIKWRKSNGKVREYWRLEEKGIKFFVTFMRTVLQLADLQYIIWIFICKNLIKRYDTTLSKSQEPWLLVNKMWQLRLRNWDICSLFFLPQFCLEKSGEWLFLEARSFWGGVASD